jgi:hypothetical protein
LGGNGGAFGAAGALRGAEACGRAFAVKAVWPAFG